MHGRLESRIVASKRLDRDGWNGVAVEMGDVVVIRMSHQKRVFEVEEVGLLVKADSVIYLGDGFIFYFYF